MNDRNEFDDDLLSDHLFEDDKSVIDAHDPSVEKNEADVLSGVAQVDEEEIIDAETSEERTEAESPGSSRDTSKKRKGLVAIAAIVLVTVALAVLLPFDKESDNLPPLDDEALVLSSDAMPDPVAPGAPTQRTEATGGASESSVSDTPTSVSLSSMPDGNQELAGQKTADQAVLSDTKTPADAANTADDTSASSQNAGPNNEELRAMLASAIDEIRQLKSQLETIKESRRQDQLKANDNTNPSSGPSAAPVARVPATEPVRKESEGDGRSMIEKPSKPNLTSGGDDKGVPSTPPVRVAPNLVVVLNDGVILRKRSGEEVPVYIGEKMRRYGTLKSVQPDQQTFTTEKGIWRKN